MSICLLRALQNKLLTRDFLKVIGVTETDQCVLCHLGLESVEHLFLNTAYVWTLCKLKLGLSGQIGSLQEEAHLIQDKFKDKTKSTVLEKLSLAASVWHIWRERNNRIFQQQQSHKIMVLEDYMRISGSF